VGGSCEHGNEPSGSIRCWEILEGPSSMELVVMKETCFIRSQISNIVKILLAVFLVISYTDGLDELNRHSRGCEQA
jgi:hypothetical protein